MPEKTDMKRIDPDLYRHPGEKEVRKRLAAIPGLTKVLDLATEYANGQVERMVEVASMVRISDGVYPKLHALWDEIQKRFGLADVPVHIAYLGDEPWRLLGDESSPRIVLSSQLLDELPKGEMETQLAMLAGMIRLGDVGYYAALDFLRRFYDYSGIVGAPVLMLGWAFEKWRRYAAFSTDRAAALVLGDVEPVKTLLVRLSGAGGTAWGGVEDHERLRLQGIEARAWDADWDVGRWRRFALTMNRRNHVALIRMLELREWADSGRMRAIMAGEEVEPEDAGKASDGAAVDPSLAFWGEFAQSAPGADVKNDAPLTDAVRDLRNMAEKGMTSFLKAGEAFWKTFQDNL